MTIVDAIQDRAGGSGELTVLGRGPAIRWAELHQRARRMAAALAAAGAGRGHRIGLLGDPSPDLVAGLQAVWLAGGSVTVLPRPPRGIPADRLRPVVADAGLDLVVVDPPAAELAAALAPARVLSLAELVRRAGTAAPAELRRPDPDDLAVLQYTSGSTRSPRGVPVTHRHLSAQLDALRQAFHPVFARPRPMLSWLPLHHDLGLIGFLAFPMAGGHPLVLQSPAAFALRPASWLAELARHRSAVTGAPDFAYRVVTPLLEAGLDLDLSAVRLMLSGGEPVSAGTMRRFLAAGARHGLDPGAVVPAYGLAEATLAVTCARPGTGLTTDSVDPDRLERDGRAVPARPGGPVRTLARLGRPVPGTRVRIVDRRTRAPAREREVGEVEVQGPSVVGHYWPEPPPPAGAWLSTGDLGYLAGGELVACGRSKDVLFAAGRNLYPPDIEAAAGQVPGVRPGGAVAFGIPGDQGDRLVVAVEARAADRARVGPAVTLAVTAETGLRPARVVVVPPGRLPRTTSGKLRRAEARRRYADGEFDQQKGRIDDQPDHRTGTGPGARSAAGLAPARARGAA
jgi:fatty-acyl-CoA synthase